MQLKQSKDNELYFTVLSKNYENLELILSKEKDERGRKRILEPSITSLIISKNDLKALTILAKNNIHLNVRDQHDRRETPIEEAIRLGRIDAIKILLNYGYHLNMEETGFRSSLWWAVYHVRHLMVVFMLENKARIDFDYCQYNPLNYVIKNISTVSRRLIAVELISAGLPTNNLEEDGRSVLHYACREGDILIVKLLLAAGARPTKMDLKESFKQNKAIYDLLIHEIHNPPSLGRQCCRFIRDYLRRIYNSDIRPYVFKLSLPPLIRDQVLVLPLYKEAYQELLKKELYEQN